MMIANAMMQENVSNKIDTKMFIRPTSLCYICPGIKKVK